AIGGHLISPRARLPAAAGDPEALLARHAFASSPEPRGPMEVVQLLRRRNEGPYRPERWRRAWLAACGLPALATAAAFGLHRFWAGSFSLDLLLAVGPPLAAIGATTL